MNCIWIIFLSLFGLTWANGELGVSSLQPIQSEAPIHMSQCPAFDDPNHIVMLPYPSDCRKYFTCLNGQQFVRQCPDGLYWSQLTYRCDYRQYASCMDNEWPDLSNPSSNVVQYQPYPGDCSRYYEKRVMQCAQGLYWNAVSQHCDLPHLSGCSPYYPIGQPPITEQTPIYVPTAATPPLPVQLPITEPSYNDGQSQDPDFLCKGTAQMGYLPYPGDCSKFIHCGPSPMVITCPTGLFWNRNTLSCGSSSSGCLL